MTQSQQQSSSFASLRLGRRRRGPAGGGASRAGFSFTEVLFAVMILGVGFIMIAAIFPVALTQTRLTTEETAAAMQTRGAVRMFEPYCTETSMPVTNGAAAALPGPVAAQMGGNFIPTGDPRQGLLTLYRRNAGWSYAQLIFVPVQVRNRSVYTPGEDAAVTFVPRTVTITQVDLTNQRVTLSGDANTLKAVGEGTYLVIEAHPQTGSVPNIVPQNYLSGRIYRIGTKSDTNIWNLSPGWDVQLDPGVNGQLNDADDCITIPTPATAFLIGRGGEVPGGAVPAGTSQDVAAYTTFINLR